jgi:ABC-type dipeptide/oligopeptide/nickel transport system permease subunit
MEGMGAGHFIFIPGVMLVGVVVGWILGSRAARDAFASELRRREKKQQQAQ